MITRQWWRKQYTPQDIAALSQELSVPLREAEFLLRRQIRSREAFQNLRETSTMASPYDLQDMDKAVTIVRQVLASGQRLRIYGDYDADGVTATAVLYRGLVALGFRNQVDLYIPNRFDEGYGLNVEAVFRAHQDGVDLMVTVDCGSSSPEAADLARTLGMGLVITDHHALGDIWPDVDALVNPECRQSTDRLSGAGVALQLVRALLDDRVPEMLYGLASIGTIADVVPLRESNRALVRRGLDAIRASEVAGVTQMFSKDGRDVAHANARDIGFFVGPRLNAAGRMGDASIATQLLTSDDFGVIEVSERELATLNQRRREIERELVAEAWSRVPRDDNGALFPFTVIAGEGWHEGVIGIVASRFREWLSRPVAIVTFDNDQGKGSARSVSGFNLIEHMRRSGDRFTKLGGHPGAAGFSLLRQDTRELSAALSKDIPSRVLSQQYLGEEYDMKVAEDDNPMELWSMVRSYEPFGHHFDMPRFVVQGSVGQARTMGQEGQHLSLTLKDQPVRAVGFGLGPWASGLTVGAPVQFLATLEENWYRGRSNPQWRIVRVEGPHPTRPHPVERVPTLPPLGERSIWIVGSEREVREWSLKLGATPYLARAPIGELAWVEESFRRGLIPAIVVSQWRPWPNVLGSADTMIWVSAPSSQRRQEEAGSLLRDGGRVYMWENNSSQDIAQKRERLKINRARLTRHWRQWQDGRVGLTVGRAIFQELELRPGLLTERRPLELSFLYRLALWQAERDSR